MEMKGCRGHIIVTQEGVTKLISKPAIVPVGNSVFSIKVSPVQGQALGSVFWILEDTLLKGEAWRIVQNTQNLVYCMP